jgi:hypothetical protein
VKIRILKACSIKGAPVSAGQVTDVAEAHGKVLLRNKYAEEVKDAPAEENKA